jgi:hypothetical protein
VHVISTLAHARLQKSAQTNELGSAAGWRISWHWCTYGVAHSSDAVYKVEAGNSKFWFRSMTEWNQ